MTGPFDRWDPANWDDFQPESEEGKCHKAMWRDLQTPVDRPSQEGLYQDWTSTDECHRCGQTMCICKPEPHRTLTEIVREAEADVTDEDLGGPMGISREEWENIRQWPEDG